MRTNNWTKVLVLILVGAIGLVGVAQADRYSEDFESYSPGQKVGAHPGWYDGGNGPTVNSGIGVAGSVGLTEAAAVFNWTALPFNWNEVAKVIIGMDFQTDGSGHLDDDRCAWTINSGSVDSSNLFGIQIDLWGGGNSGYNIEGYWDGGSSSDRRPSIVDMPALSANAWYRLRVEIIKLTATSASIYVELWSLDVSGTPDVLIASGAIGDTSELGDDAPHSKYFTSGLCPAYKNYTTAAAAADNAYFEIVPVAPAVAYVTETDGSTVVTEEGPTSDDFTVELVSQPTTNVTITVEPSINTQDIDLGSGAGQPIALTFTDSNWDTPQIVAVTAVNDMDEEGDEVAVISFTVSSTDPDFDNGWVSPLNVTVIDNDAVTDAGLQPMCTGPVENDINGDCEINMEDLGLIASDWLASDANSTDLNNDDIVNFADFARIASGWLDSKLVAGPWILHIIDDSSSGADGVKLADVNNDGLMDITTGWEEGGITRVYLHPGYEDANERWPAVTVGQTPNVEDAVFVDLDNDGAVDVVSSCEADTKKLLVNWAPADANDYLDPDSWQTEVIPESDGLIRWYFCASMQVDGINGIDIVAGTKDTNGQIGWFQSPANPRSLADFQYHKICDARWIMSLITCDMDGDGDLDVVLTDRKEPALQGCRWLENPGPGPNLYLPWTNHFIANTEQEPKFMKIADLDQDGLDDVVVAIDPGVLYFRRLDPNGLLWQRRDINHTINTGVTKGVAVGDIDKDGRQDIVFTCTSADGKYGAGWLSYPNDVNDQTWIHHDISGDELGIKYDRIELLDMDGDGDLDVLTCEEDEYSGSTGLGVIWYENPYY